MSRVCYVYGLLYLSLLCLGFVKSKVFYVQGVLCLGFVMSSVCYVWGSLCLGIVVSRICLSRVCYVQCLSILGWLWHLVSVQKARVFMFRVFVSRVCFVYGLLCIVFVMSRVCHVQGLLCLVFVISKVCYVQGLLYLRFVMSGCVMSRVCYM